MHPFQNTAVRAARKAGDIIIRGLARFEGVETATKGLNDYVTSIDHAAEAAIIEILREAYPHHAFLAEESGASGNADTTWIIDPLDGTTNFMHGFPVFAVSIACQVQGRLEHGVIYDPMRQELFTASRGEGAYLENRRLRVSRQRTLEGALIATGFPYRENLHYLDNYMAMMRTVITRAAGLRRPGAASLDLAYVAAGRVDGFWEIGLKPWDTAAGCLMIREAGGLIGTLDGGEYKQGGNIVAGNPRVFNALVEALAPHVPADLREIGGA
jgi:myo-inositol-1(or 4)-monophosphatase